ncbi:DNA-3-methyladenine glycosylase family protein [uncultured Enterovirga sp.]|uniref:DNA-3-methyladenine glycosylase family protein n=1 Tax=uncultured Enterovirga sp. TaxID=2026352 RepID=UPI0035CABD5A
MARLIDSEDALAAGLAELVRLDPVMAELVARGIRPPLRKREPGFAGLAAIVMGQQLSTASAAAIYGRLAASIDPLSPDTILAASDEDLRRPGLSGAKIRTLRAVAAAIKDGTLPLDGLAEMPAERAHACLTAVSGIGPWTADIYLMFCLGHPDSFAAGDLALQEAARLAYGLPARPTARDLAIFAERWRPWRTAAAGMLWAYYRQRTSREGVLAAPLPA